MNFVILAAGQGSRFVKEGEMTPKPMISILGKPMIDRLIEVLVNCGASTIYIVTNAAMNDVTAHLEQLKADKKLPLVVRPIVSDNSFYSLECACEGIEGRFIAMTADAIFPEDEFKCYVDAAKRCSSGEMLMGLTEYIDDESPLYANLSLDGSEVVDYRYGGEPFGGHTPTVSAGLYAITRESVKRAKDSSYPESLSDFQRILATRDDFTVKPYMFTKAFDVDHLHDREEAERFITELQEATIR